MKWLAICLFGAVVSGTNRPITVYRTFNSSTYQDGYYAIASVFSDFPALCPQFMPIVDVLTEEDPPGAVLGGLAPPPDDDLLDRLEFFNRQTGRWCKTVSPTDISLLILAK